jgi:protein-tyrosine phosphatase
MPGSPRPLSSHLAASQRSRQVRFAAERSVDLHCHILPGVDDGPPAMDDALALCRMMVRDGFTDIVATPHMLGRWETSNVPADIRLAVTQLQQELDAHHIPLNIYPGGEVRIDERIPRLLQSDGILTLADGKRYLLLELPPVGRIDPAMVMPHFTAANVRVILAHAERYESLCEDHNAAAAWLDAGAALQLNASSLLGGTGQASMDAAWDWLGSGWIALIATDSHSVGSRRPRMAEVIDLIAKELDEATAKTVCIDNPAKVLLGQELDAL